MAQLKRLTSHMVSRTCTGKSGWPANEGGGKWDAGATVRPLGNSFVLA
jgi:hypothetical protein